MSANAERGRKALREKEERFRRKYGNTLYNNGIEYYERSNSRESQSDADYDGGNLSYRSFVFTTMTKRMYEAGVSGTFFVVNIIEGVWPFTKTVYSHKVDFKTLYVGFPSQTEEGGTFSTRAAAIISAEAFNNAAKSLALDLNFMTPQQVKMLTDDKIQNMFMGNVVFYLMREVKGNATISRKKSGKNTITTPAVWGKY